MRRIRLRACGYGSKPVCEVSVSTATLLAARHEHDRQRGLAAAGQLRRRDGGERAARERAGGLVAHRRRRRLLRPLPVDVLALLAREAARLRGACGTARRTSRPRRASSHRLRRGALEERGRSAAAEAALAELDLVALAAAVIAVDEHEALDRRERMRRREGRLHARQVALHEDMRARGCGARSGKQGERKREGERGARHTPDGSTARAGGKARAGEGRILRRFSAGAPSRRGARPRSRRPRAAR